MIYTANLNERTQYILVYDRTTPLDVVRLSFRYDPLNEYDLEACTTKQAWSMRVKGVLKLYADMMELNVDELSARPIKCHGPWNLLTGE